MSKLLVISGLPDAAVGVHKVVKVKLLRTTILSSGIGKQVDYPIILLDNGVTFSLFPVWCNLRTTHVNGARLCLDGYAFSNAVECLIMGEGCEFNLQKKKS